MADFNDIYIEFENTKNVCDFCEKYKEDDIATRFLLVRSLDKSNLKDIISFYSEEDDSGYFKDLTEKAFNSSASIEQLVLYIESKRQELLVQREIELDGLQEVLSNIPILNCGVRNDKIDDIVKSFVRNKSLKSYDDLIDELDNTLLPKIRQYSLWSYYNQTANDIIELFFLRHPRVIPTLRKIHNIDFFIKVDDKIIPFDLKFTHISDDYFDLASQGIIRDGSPTHYDTFYADDNPESNETKKIKAFYKAFRKNHTDISLPNIGTLEKNDLCNILISTEVNEAVQFVEAMKQLHKEYVPSTADELYKLEWWNYKYQGERLFCNNNRLFVFIAFRDQFIDGRALKGKTEEIGYRINSLLNNLTLDDIHRINYHYDKEESLVGDYSALSISTIYSE